MARVSRNRWDGRCAPAFITQPPEGAPPVARERLLRTDAGPEPVLLALPGDMYRVHRRREAAAECRWAISTSR